MHEKELLAMQQISSFKNPLRMERTTKCIDKNNWIPGSHAHLPFNCCFCANSFTFFYIGRKSVMVAQLLQ